MESKPLDLDVITFWSPIFTEIKSVKMLKCVNIEIRFLKKSLELIDRRTNMEKLKFPYGFSDFDLLRRENYFYVDRTHHIRLIEEAGNQILFLRPRRFGKSLLLSMLENYYDVAKADEFAQLFGDLAIGQNPTLRHNQYFVKKWDFSNVSPEGDNKQIENILSDDLNESIQDFADYYQSLLQISISINPSNAVAS
ncbi:AAA family ATPase, partial [Candidatus Marithioploca araucensis]|nr:AAA family ATPase [Candidatus Marithioploca araucensis]